MTNSLNHISPIPLSVEEWGRYTRGCDAVVFVVDSHDAERLPEAKVELHRLLEQRCINSNGCCYTSCQLLDLFCDIPTD